jgi:hypothetical protein
MRVISHILTNFSLFLQKPLDIKLVSRSEVLMVKMPVAATAIALSEIPFHS